MLHRFTRTELLIREEGLAKLAESTVAVFGVGGVGSFAVEALAQVGIGHLVLIDYDDICLTNINRQFACIGAHRGSAQSGADAGTGAEYQSCVQLTLTEMLYRRK